MSTRSFQKSAQRVSPNKQAAAVSQFNPKAASPASQLKQISKSERRLEPEPIKSVTFQSGSKDSPAKSAKDIKQEPDFSSLAYKSTHKKMASFDMRQYEVMGMLKSQVDQAKKCFDLFDEDSKGVIRASELLAAVDLLAVDPLKKASVKCMLRVLRDQHSNEVLFSQFMEIMGFKTADQQNRELLYGLVDQQQKGHVTELDLVEVARRAGVAVSGAELSAVFRSLDKDSDGTISKAEFLETMS